MHFYCLKLCNGFGFGFGAIGKRNVDSRAIQSRDLSFECCDTDFCNYPTSTAQPTTVTTPMTTIQYVHGMSPLLIIL